MWKNQALLTAVVIVEGEALVDDDTETFGGAQQLDGCTGNADCVDRDNALLNRANTDPDGP